MYFLQILWDPWKIIFRFFIIIQSMPIYYYIIISRDLSSHYCIITFNNVCENWFIFNFHRILYRQSYSLSIIICFITALKVMSSGAEMLYPGWGANDTHIRLYRSIKIYIPYNVWNTVVMQYNNILEKKYEYGSSLCFSKCEKNYIGFV